MTNLYIIIPTYNERENIAQLLPYLEQLFRQERIGGGVIVVDDNSPDGTAAVAKEAALTLARDNFDIHLIERPGKLGLGTAYIAGFRQALANGADYIMEMDADFSHNPDYIPDFLRLLKEADVVIGSRYVSGGGVENWSWHRRAISRLGSRYSRLILGWDIQDATAGYMAYRRQVLETINLDDITSNGYIFQAEMKHRAHRHGFKLVETPIIFADRKLGQSKMNSRIVLEAIWKVWHLHWQRHV